MCGVGGELTRQTRANTSHLMSPCFFLWLYLHPHIKDVLGYHYKRNALRPVADNYHNIY